MPYLLIRFRRRLRLRLLLRLLLLRLLLFRLLLLLLLLGLGVLSLVRPGGGCRANHGDRGYGAVSQKWVGRLAVFASWRRQGNRLEGGGVVTVPTATGGAVAPHS
eukprot:889564-Prorocentrum_minimum.AAC.1